MLRAGWPRLPAGVIDSCLPHRVRTSSGAQQSCIQWVHGFHYLGVKWPGREVGHLPPSSAEVKNMWSYTSAISYVFNVWYLIKNRDNFTFFTVYLVGKTYMVNSTDPTFLNTLCYSIMIIYIVILINIWYYYKLFCNMQDFNFKICFTQMTFVKKNVGYEHVYVISQVAMWSV
jgi:hypothetical protein